ncbi:hypothetical protein PRUPE_7G129000 [Prunus persica]|uniref:Uncharacterized protein n=1 Tax=Prunus persica TaxID=3760 RepID=A0A251NAR4_PRUPE|nr:hypothetical protein PRUPE_7G129000 [Prunus persica]
MSFTCSFSFVVLNPSVYSSLFFPVLALLKCSHLSSPCQAVTSSVHETSFVSSSRSPFAGGSSIVTKLDFEGLTPRRGVS